MEVLTIILNFELQASNLQLKNHEKICKPDSVLPKKRLLFVCVLHCCKTLADYPSAFRAGNSYFHC